MADKKGPGLDVGLASIFSAASSFAGSYYDSQMQKIAAEMQAQQAEFNAKMAEYQSREAIRQGEEEAKSYQDKIEGLIGTQRSSAAAQGIVVDYGSAKTIVDQTYEDGIEDVQTIRNNAWKRAYGFDVQAAQYRLGAKIQLAQSKFNATSTLVAGGLDAVNTGVRTYSSLSRVSKSGSRSDTDNQAATETLIGQGER